jgi:hypothetical protein
MTRNLTPARFLAMVYLDAKERVAPRDLPMRLGKARRVLARIARKGYAVRDYPAKAGGTYMITVEGAEALAAAREQARHEAGLS